MTGAWRFLDRQIGVIVDAAKWLALPLVILLFLQWPLRDLVRAYSREANDLGQVAFALFVAVSVTAATRARTHLAADLLARRYSARTRRHLARIGAAIGLLPWAVFILVISKTTVVSSVQHLEAFQDSGNPGYFLIKLALWLMAVVVIAPGARRCLPPLEGGRRMMAWVGLALLVLVGLGIIFTGLPAAVVLVAVASLGAISA